MVDKKVCFVATDAISFNVLYRGQLEYLAKANFDITLICGGASSELDALCKRQVGRVIDCGLVRRPNVFYDLVSLVKIFWHFLFNRYDLVVMTTPKAIFLGSISAFFAMQPRRISFFRGRVYENYIGLKRKFYVFLDYVAVLLSDEVVFVSQSLMKEFVRDIKGAQRKGKVIGAGSGNGVCVDRFSPDAVSPRTVDKMRHSLGIKDTEFIVLSVGRVCDDKGLREIADVASLVEKRMPNVRFLMLGPIEDSDSFCLVSDLKRKGKVIHVDFVDDTAPYFALADVHLFLSHREGFGNVAIEAASMGVPTLAFDVVGVRDSVSEGVSGLRFDLGDIKSVSEAIVDFSQNPRAIKMLFPDSRAWAIKQFSKDHVWLNYKKFYLNENVTGGQQ